MESCDLGIEFKFFVILKLGFLLLFFSEVSGVVEVWLLVGFGMVNKSDLGNVCWGFK